MKNRVITLVMSVILFAATAAKAAQTAKFELGSVNAGSTSFAGEVVEMDGKVGAVFDTTGCLPLTFNGFQLDVNAGPFLQFFPTTVRLAIYTNIADIALQQKAYSYVVSSQSGLTWGVLSTVAFTGSSSLPPDVVPVTKTLIVIPEIDETTVQIRKERVRYRRVDGGTVEFSNGTWRANTDAKIAVRLFVNAIQPSSTEQVSIRAEATTEGFGPLIRIYWPRGLNNVQVKMKSHAPLGTKFDDWWTYPYGFGSTDVWWWTQEPIDNRFPAEGLAYRIVW